MRTEDKLSDLSSIALLWVAAAAVTFLYMTGKVLAGLLTPLAKVCGLRRC